MKNNIDFYQHYADADQHPKFKMLRVQFGWAGEGRFWALNNRIAQADNCCLNVSKKYNAASIASDLGLSLEEFEKFIDCLKTDCELIKECSPGVITTDIIQENFKSVSVNREKARERKQRYLEKVSKGSPELLNSSPDQNKKVKESKVKESKDNIYSSNFIKFWELYPKKTGKWAAFQAYKKIKEPRPTLQQIELAIKNQNQTEQWQNLQFIPNPATWLNQRRWEDETETTNKKVYVFTPQETEKALAEALS